MKSPDRTLSGLSFLARVLESSTEAQASSQKKEGQELALLTFSEVNWCSSHLETSIAVTIVPNECDRSKR